MYQAVAVTQYLIDSLSCVLIFFIAMQLRVNATLALIAASLHAINPFQVIWVPISATEILSTLSALGITLFMLRCRLYVKHIFLLGVLIGIATLLRQWLGIFIVIAFAWTFVVSEFRLRKLLRANLCLFVGFCLALFPWVLRNWINHGTPYVLMGETRGVYYHGPDFEAFDNLFSKIDENVNRFVGQTVEEGEVEISDLDLDPGVELLIQKAVRMAHKCGPSFVSRRGERTVSFSDRDRACEARVIDAFNHANRTYRDSVGFLRYRKTKLDALYKAIFKRQLVNAEAYRSKNVRPKSIFDVFITISFVFRSFIVISGLLSIMALRSRALVAAAFPIFMYIFIPIIMIHVEMRYLIQADAILLALSTVTFYRMYMIIRQPVDLRN